MPQTDETIRTTVQEFYAERARTSDSCCGSSGSSCAELYSADLLINVPEDVSGFSLGCGDPISLAALQPGETVLDLGSGGGLDCFLAARQVGEHGAVIGVDMTPEMLARAQASAARLGIANVEFRQGYLEQLPVETASIDAVISNCVINLSPDKSQVFAEIHRVLKPGGRISVSDIVLNGELPEAVRKDMQAWSACAAGALPIEEFEAGLLAAGFEQVTITAKNDEGGMLPNLPQDTLFSAHIAARKP
ncbi:MAG: arsenite methyltransferase [Anaerolineae bacterium]|nr:arsenite methyltransferase [Anaerolineae bacterium]